MTWLMEDKALLAGFRAGDPESLLKVYRLYATDVFRFVSRGFSFRSGGQLQRFNGLGLGFECEDLVQEIFEKAFSAQARTGYDGLHPFGNYLFGIARNHLLNWLRHQNVVERFETNLSGKEPPAVKDAPALDSEERILTGQIDAIMKVFREGLIGTERGIFDVRLVEAASVEETARRLGVSEYRVKRTDKALRRRLLVEFKQHGLLSWVPVNRLTPHLMGLICMAV